MFRFAHTTDTVFAELIALPAALAALADLGFTEVTYTDGYIISKPPHSPQLFWHYDWFAWQEPEMHEAAPPQVFLMYYLTDTRRQNGCLRVIPGSHTRYNELHDLLAAPCSPLWYQPDYPTLPERVQAQMVAKTQPLSEAWSAHGRELVARLLPVYHGDAEPHGFAPSLRILPPVARESQTPPESPPRAV